jgi:hypothetical protein
LALPDITFGDNQRYFRLPFAEAELRVYRHAWTQFFLHNPTASKEQLEQEKIRIDKEVPSFVVDY